MRGRMSDAKSAQPQPLNETMIMAPSVRWSEFAQPGVRGRRQSRRHGWLALYSTATGRGDIRKVDLPHIPLSAYLGVVGMPGMTAWYGLNKICEPKAAKRCASMLRPAPSVSRRPIGEAEGCTVVGVGRQGQMRHVTSELGFDACIDYKAYPEPKDFTLRSGRDAEGH